jgi:nucleoid-associated protein YgaU
MARLRNDSRRHRTRRSLRRLFPLWLIACLIGLGLALAAYEQQRRGGIEVAETPPDAAENRVAEAGADPAQPPDPSTSSSQDADADLAAKLTSEAPLLDPTEEPAGGRETDPNAEAARDVATGSDRASEQAPARGPDGGPARAPAEAGTEPVPADETERLATLDQRDPGEPGTPSELRSGSTAARPGSEELPGPREAEESPSDAPSGVADAPAPPRPMTPAREPASPSAPERQIAASTDDPSREARAGRPAEPGGAPSAAEPETETESLVADTLRRALAALLGGRPDERVQPLEPPEQPEPRDKLAGQSPTAPQLAAVEPKEEAKPHITAPTFDVVRVQRGGQAVIAGRAAPGAEVELRAGGEVIDRVHADPRGQWISVPLRRLPAGEQELTVAARSGDALPIESEQVVVLAVPGDEPAADRADHPAAAAVALEAPGEEALAVLLPKHGRREGRVLQAPGRIGSDGQLALLMLDYDETGQIRLSGEASPGARVRVYVDNELSGEAVVGEDGAWTCTLERALAPGSYTLRVDQLDPAGRTVARLETPFTRVAQPPVQGDALVDYVIVQPGNSLWRIARRLLGNGFEYVHIYEANDAQIRDPDLIYPGQVFEIPIGVAGSG